MFLDGVRSTLEACEDARSWYPDWPCMLAHAEGVCRDTVAALST